MDSLRTRIDARGLRCVGRFPEDFRDVYHVGVDVVVDAQPLAQQAATEDRLAWGNNFEAQAKGEEGGTTTAVFRVTCGRLSRVMTALQLTTVCDDHAVAYAIEAVGDGSRVTLGTTPVTAAGIDWVPLVVALLHYMNDVM